MLSQLNKEQLEAVKTEEQRVVIIAPPGSGKTFTMVKSIEYFLEKNPKDNVVAITFTKKAAGELSHAFFGNDKIHASTIHSWSYSHLEGLAKKWGFRVRLLQEEQIISIIKPFLKLYHLNKDKVLYSVYHYVMGNYNIDLEDHIKNKYKAILDKYIEFKRQRSLYDFTDLPLYLHDVMEEYEEYIKVDGLFVDEFQDVDPVQLKVFNRVEAKKYFFIGDPNQAIYIFRGASEEIFKELVGYKIMPLKHNYRSYQEILDYASSIRNSLMKGYASSMLDITEIYESDIIAERGDGGFVMSEGLESKINFRRTLKKELNEHKYQILVRTNKMVKEINEIGIDSVMTIHKAKGLEFENVIVVDFEINDQEAINVAFVGLTRAENREIIVSFDTLKRVLELLPPDVINKQRNIVSAF